MKFSKFVKSSQSTKPSSSNGIYKKKSSTNAASSTLNTSSLMMAQQLLLTDDICRFQPQKNKLFLDEATTSKLSNASSNNENNYASSYAVTTPRINFTNLVTNINGSGSGKYLKSSQPKRLQRNRLQHVTSKPENYVLRSTLNLQSSDLTSSMAMVSWFNSLNGKSNNNSLIFKVDSFFSFHSPLIFYDLIEIKVYQICLIVCTRVSIIIIIFFHF